MREPRPHHSAPAEHAAALVDRAVEAAVEAAAPADPTLARNLRRGIPWLIGGGVLYLLAPSVLGVLAAADRLVEIDWYWLLGVAAAQAVALWCTWVLQRRLMRTKGQDRPPLRLVAASQVVGATVGAAAPVGGAAGTAVQVRILSRRGIDPRRATSGLITFSLLQIASVGALALVGPLMVLVGVGVPDSLARTALLGCAALLLITLFLVVVLRSDTAADRIGAFVAMVSRRPPQRIIVTLRRERRHLRRALSGPGSWKVLAIALARSVADYACLLAAVAAVTPKPSPPLVLLAFVAAGVLRLFPFTPGGLGPVEAALISLLAAGPTTRDGAVLATLAYRIASLWIPMLLAIPGAWWLKRHQGPLGAREVETV